MTGPDGKTTSVHSPPVAPGLSRATLDRRSVRALPRRATASTSRSSIVGPENPLEFQEVVSTPEKLRPLAEATGGSVRRLADGPSDAIDMPRARRPARTRLCGGDYIGVKRTGASELVGVGSDLAGAGFLGLAALLGALIWAWLARRAAWFDRRAAANAANGRLAAGARPV